MTHQKLFCRGNIAKHTNRVNIAHLSNPSRKLVTQLPTKVLSHRPRERHQLKQSVKVPQKALRIQLLLQRARTQLPTKVLSHRPRERHQLKQSVKVPQKALRIQLLLQRARTQLPTKVLSHRPRERNNRK